MADIDNKGDMDVAIRSVNGEVQADVNVDGELLTDINNVATDPVFFILRDKTTSTNQANVDSAGRVSTTAGFSADTDPIAKFATVAATVTFPLTILTYTVTTGHTLFISNWHLQANGGNSLGTIKINGTAKSEYFCPSTTGLQQYAFGETSPLVALAGDVITIVAEVGSSVNKTYFASFNGYELAD